MTYEKDHNDAIEQNKFIDNFHKMKFVLEHEVAIEINMWVDEFSKSNKETAIEMAWNWVNGQYTSIYNASQIQKMKAWIMIGATA